ncbi:hypothetical protein GOBAR_AA04672 [Gossypium barbadense]|uniref:Uncharacterized protein n=1 Tax=Gossypium barbadense TaxID=3634 RepID=A0A2P5YJW8_GOSBA|nr:hypothetical protein GOBAR_AA04672 [Gossypium barbadense]
MGACISSNGYADICPDTRFDIDFYLEIASYNFTLRCAPPTTSTSRCCPSLVCPPCATPSSVEMAAKFVASTRTAATSVLFHAFPLSRTLSTTHLRPTSANYATLPAGDAGYDISVGV